MSRRHPIFVVQRHDASRLHYDFRLEMAGVLKSWAVPKGPSEVPGEKRLAVETTDHALSYAAFQGDIPAGNYGAGSVATWDNGTVEYILSTNSSPEAAYEAGELKCMLRGDRLRGTYTLIRIQSTGPKSHWLLTKQADSQTPRL